MKPIDVLLEVLREEQVTRIFGNPGTTELELIDALAGAEDIEYVLGLQESAVVSMAEGFARATRRPAVVSLHAAAGLANGLVGLINARESRTPLVVLVGQQHTGHLVQEPLLSGDLAAIASAGCKVVMEVVRPDDLGLMLRRAFQAARAAPAGPVFLSLPMDVLASHVEVSMVARSGVVSLGAAANLDEAARALRGARAPAIVAGDGVGRGDALREIVSLVEHLPATVYHQPFNEWLDFPTTHLAYAGALPPVNAGIRTALDEHDVIFLVGTRAFRPLHYTPVAAVPPSARVIQLADDADEVGRNYPADIALVGDIKSSLARLASIVASMEGGQSDTGGGVFRARRAAAENVARQGSGRVPVPPDMAVLSLLEALPEEAVIVDEAITTGEHIRVFLERHRDGTYCRCGSGGLGWGTGFAIGYSMARPEDPVVAVLGDGAALFGLQGLWSAARYRIPVVFVVMNNREYRTLKHSLIKLSGTSVKHDRFVGMDIDGPAVDWMAIGESFGIDSRRVTDAADIGAAVRHALAQRGPVLVEIPIESIDPALTSGAAIQGGATEHAH